MILQGTMAIEHGIFRDITLIFIWMSFVMLLYISFQVGRRIKDAKIISATTGFTVYILTFSMFLLFSSLPNLYAGLFPIIFEGNAFFYMFGSIFYLSGMYLFIFLLEIDNVKNNPFYEKRRVNYPLSLISFFLIIICSPFIILINELIPILFGVIVPPFIVASAIFMRTFQSLEIVKRAKPMPWFFTGLLISGMSNFLYSNLFASFMANLIPIIRAICILSGCIMTVYAWNRIPNYSEFNWMMKMEQLIVIHINSSTLLYQYNFISQDRDKESDSKGILAGSAMGGIDMLLKEVLTSTGHIKEIDHGDKKIIFTHGSATACVLIVSAPSMEFRYRLEMFHLSFEKRFGGEKLNNWDGEVSIFNKTDDLIQNNFLL